MTSPSIPKSPTFLLLLYSITVSVLLAGQASSTAILAGERMHPAKGQKGMVVTSHYLATDSALEVLQSGGNAIDAAVTAAFALAVTQPRSGNIGGGGFMLISSEIKNDVVSIDYREKAPSTASADMFLDSNNILDTNRVRYSHQAAGVPGTVAGLSLALEKYGTISLQQAMAPAIKLAEEGFLVTPRFSSGLKQKKAHLQRWPSTKKTFYKEDGSFYEPGDLFQQKELATTLRRIARNGPEEFYTGETARMLVKQMAQNNGLISMEDMANYKPVIRYPVRGTYRGYDIYSMGPPSSGGTHLIQMLNILEHFPISDYGHNSALAIHAMAETMKRTYADRAHYLGDPDFIKVPTLALTSKPYGQKLAKEIDLTRATPSKSIRHGNPLPHLPVESNETTHFSVVDSFGNSVSNTYTINFSYGSGIVVKGAGFLLNNEMDDFSTKPGTPNAYGLLGGEANKIEANKRMLSSMSPTIVKRDDKNFLVIGTPGGSRIITTTLQVIMNVVDHGLNIQSAVSAPRIHHQWFPDEIRIEQGISADTITSLESRGHSVSQKQSMGAAQSIMIKGKELFGGADPRRSTSLAAGF